MRSLLLVCTLVWAAGCRSDNKVPPDFSGDVDGDGFESPEDCDDADPAVFPGADEVPYDGIDQDCVDGDLDDQDGDGVAATEAGGLDCDDTDPEIGPSVEDIPYDGIDQDCTGSDFDDVDGDGHSSAEVEDGDDCDDMDPEISPSAEETPYDGIDDDCSGADLTDVDGDGYDSTEVEGGTDCDDTSDIAYPGAEEVPYDGLDQDCDELDLTDVDGDGDDWEGVGGGDCDDTDPYISSFEDEIPYDGIDQDCTGADLTDVDGDGFDAEEVGGMDCDDDDDDRYPDAPELDDLQDNDCDGISDEDFISVRDIVINEIMADPSEVGDSYGEWLEVYNQSDRAINLRGWGIADGDGTGLDMTIEDDVSIDPGEYVVMGVNADFDTNGFVTVDYEYAWGDLTLVNEDLSLYLKMGDVTIHSVGPTRTKTPLFGSSEIDATPGVSYGRVGRWASGFTGLPSDRWCDQQTGIESSGDVGTPGTLNDICGTMECVDGERIMEGETLTGDTTGAGDRNPYTGCAGWFIGNPDLTYAFVAESAGCYRFTAGDPESEEDPIAAWNTSIAIADSCEVDSFYDCDDASSGWWGYIDASLDSYLSAGEEVYVLVNGNVPDGTLTAEGPGEFEISITQLGTGMCSDEEF